MSTQPNQNMSGETEGDAPRSEQHGSFRLDALGVSGTESMIEGPPKKRVPTQFVVLGALAIVAAGALYAMRRLGMGPMGAVAEVNVDWDFDRPGAAGSDHEKLLADLNSNHIEHQVPPNEVQKNPFKMPDILPPHPSEPTTKGPAVDPREKELAEREAKIKAALATLRVHTVLTGTVPVARIGEENVRVGDKILDGLFTVESIAGRAVELRAGDQVYTLSLDDDVVGKAPAHRTTAPQRPVRK